MNGRFEGALELMLVVVLLPPILLVIMPRIALRNPRARINVPHREYWLAPERRVRIW